MPQVSSIWLQAMTVGLLTLLAQFRYLEHYADVKQQARVPYQAKYREIRDRVLATDRQLLEAVNQLPVSNMSKASDLRMGLVDVDRLKLATRFSLNVEKPCGGNYGLQTTLVVLVLNRVEDYFQRKAIRATYGSALTRRSPKGEIYFVVARRLGPELQRRVQQESQAYNDIIQVDYSEDYYNCTIKAVAILRWMALYCPLAKFLFKIDDDSFIRVNPLLAELDQLEPTAILGNLGVLSEVPRENNSKWAITEQNYPDYFYPSYIPGIYLMPGSFAILLYEAIMTPPRDLTIPALPFEDVYITGILAVKSRLRRLYWRSQLLLTDKIELKNKTLAQYNVMYNTLCPLKMRDLWERFGED